eukprot:scaffold3744_cov33-Tisochrysis_lutea.AAC.2
MHLDRRGRPSAPAMQLGQRDALLSRSLHRRQHIGLWRYSRVARAHPQPCPPSPPTDLQSESAASGRQKSRLPDRLSRRAARQA